MKILFRLYALVIVLCSCIVAAMAQNPGVSRHWLTIDTIMRDPAWMGVSPTNPFWSEDGERLYFTWRREGDTADSLYVSHRSTAPVKVSLLEQKKLPSRFGDYSRDYSRKIYSRSGDIIVLDCKRGLETPLTQTLAFEGNPRFLADERFIVFERENNLFIRDLSTGLERQITNLRQGAKPTDPSKTPLQQFLTKQQQELFDVVRKRKQEADDRKKRQESLEAKKPQPFYTGQKSVQALSLSPDAKFVTFMLVQQAQDAKRTIVPNYVTESGFTEDLPARTKVGESQSSFELYVFDTEKDSTRRVMTGSLPGIMPAVRDTTKGKTPTARGTFFAGPYWSESGHQAMMQVFSQDNKDRWITLLDVEKATLSVTLDRQTDSAWVGGPGIVSFGSPDNDAIGWMPGEQRVWFISEADGWAHLYTVATDGTGKTQHTKGKFEIYEPFLSRDKKRWYFHSNEVHFGERHLYSMALDGGARTKLTTMEGRNDALLSPDGQTVAITHSFSNKLPELYLLPTKSGSTAQQLTRSPSKEFANYAWANPQVLTFTAKDGANVPARLYKPAQPNGAAVIFVHGAGYLQNAHKWWSSYFREYMFHNLLVDKGYTVLDIDYRASAGLGRDWRTGIYRFMGGKDLDDHIDGAKFLVQQHGVDAKRIGIYGGSYGGFITLMAMFTRPGVFAAGAALRPVTDWAHYNHPYTSNILNLPQTDTLSFYRSSPINHAAGLQGALLMCHGVVDVNVHAQDVMRLAQRLIELRKERWELALYPVEDHGFREPTSWMDEYKRILLLFETHLKK